MTEHQTMDAYKAGFKEGQLHVSPSPETTRMIEEMRTEWRQLKARFFYSFVAALSVAVGYGIWVGTIQNRIDSGEVERGVLTASVAAIDSRQRASDIASTEIKTKLVNIEMTLIEIKNALRR